MPIRGGEEIQRTPEPGNGDDLSLSEGGEGELAGREVKPVGTELPVEVPKGEAASASTTLESERVSEGEVTTPVKRMTPEEFTAALQNGEDFGNRKIIVTGDLFLDSDIDPSLLKNLEVKGDLICDGQIKTLPDNLQVGGDLFGSRMSLETLPNNLHVGGYLNLSYCTSLTTLPDNLQVEGKLNLIGCTSLATLPDNLQVGGNLYLSGCTSLTTLPNNLQVDGDLGLTGCTSLTTLPNNLQVEGDLKLTLCQSLTTLPDNLQVGRDLYLTRCTSLTILPDNLQLGRNLDLTGCTSLTSLPNWIVRLGPVSEDEARYVNLTRTGLSDFVLERLRDTETPGMQFYFSRRAAQVGVPIADSVDEGLDPWMKLLPAGSEKPNLQFEPDQVRTVCTYLARLTNTAEYKNQSTRLLLAQRVVNLFQALSEDEGLKDVVLNVIEGGLETCDDRVINSFDEVDLAVKIYQADQRGDEAELRELAKGILMLEHVRAKANEHIATLTWVDEIEVMLAYQIGLQEKLNLPISTKNMIFRRCAQVSDEKLETVGDEIVKEVTDEKVEAFLKDWDPWKKHLRREAVQSYDAIPQTNETPESWRCPISAVDFGSDGDAEDELPVLYEGIVYDYDSFKKVFIDSGTNPFNRLPIQWEKLRRIDTPSRKSS